MGVVTARGTTVMLVSLDFSEVFTFSAFEAVVTVKLEKGSIACKVCAGVVDSPYKFFYRVVEAKFVLSAGSIDCESIRVLDLFDEVFV